jgi:hypothetical protein
MGFADVGESRQLYCRSRDAYNRSLDAIHHQQLAKCLSLVHTKVGTVLRHRTRKNHWRPASAADRPNVQDKKGDVGVDMMQAMFGDVLLLLAGLAMVLLAIILVLVEADLILRLGRKLTEHWTPTGMDSSPSRPQTRDQFPAEHASEEDET